MPGSIIKQKREQVGISQQEMAERLHLSQSAYCRIENRQTALRVDMAKKIAAILACEMDDLLPDEVYIDNAHVLDHSTENLPDQLTLEQVEALLDKKIATLKEWLAAQLQQQKSF